MGEERIEAIRAAYAAYNRGDWDSFVTQGYHEDAVWEGAEGDISLETQRGRRAFAQAWEAWESVEECLPASYDEVLAATALADFDGQPGGLSTPSSASVDGARCGSQQVDDHAASFSDYATLPSDQAHTIAAPGVCILSDYLTGKFPEILGGQFALDTGTSMASPHVAGTAALCIASGACARLTPAQIIQKLRSDAAAYNQGHPSYGFTGDPLRPETGKYYGYLIHAGSY